jgi:predicted RND superfamily exporter protein
MLNRLGGLIGKKPWLVVTIILLFTVGFATLIPSLEMETSTEDFLPDHEIVQTSVRVGELFGGSGQLIMIFVENQNARNAITPTALREEYKVLQELDEKHIEIEVTSSIAGFVDIICQIEFGDSLQNCTDEQITIAFNDLMAEIYNFEEKMLTDDDRNEEIDFDSNKILSKGKNIDSLDIKNYYIDKKDDEFTFSIEVYDLSEFKDTVISPDRNINTWEWFISFDNLIIPDESLENINYQISAHIEPSEPFWEVGKGIFGNTRAILDNIRNQSLFNSYKSEVYLWIRNPDQDISFPINLKTGYVNFSTDENRVEIIVDKSELGKYGIASSINGIELPAKISNTKAGVRVYQTPVFHKDWNRIIFDLNYLQNISNFFQNRPIIGPVSEKFLNFFSDFSWEDFDELFEMLNSKEFSIDSISLKEIERNWVLFDEAPDNDYSDNQYYVKPNFIEDLKTATLAFLPPDYTEDSDPSYTLMIVQLNTSSNNVDLSKVNRDIVSSLISLDSEEQFVSMSATGEGIIDNEIYELTQEANSIIIPLIFVVISIIFLIMFRRLSYIFLPLMSLAIALIWTFGTMVLLGISFSSMMVAIVPLLIGLGVDFSVHLFHNYRLELKKGKNPGESIKSSINNIGMAMFLATLTTVIAFLSFLTASVPPLRDFGIICALGIIYTLITAFTFQAAFRIILDRNRKKLVVKNSKKFSLDKTMENFSIVVLKQRKIILVFTILVTVFFAFGGLNVETTFDTTDFLPEGTESIELIEDIGEYFPSASEDQDFILIEGDVATVDALTGISKTYENLRDDSYVVINQDGKPKQISVISIIRSAVKENSSIATKFNIDSNGIPNTDDEVIALYDFLYDHESYKLDVEGVLHKNNDGYYDATLIRVYTNINYVVDDVSFNEAMGIFYDQLNEDLEDYGNADSFVTGETSSIYIILESLTESQILSIFISIILATLVLIIVFKNPILGLIAIVPVGLCLIWIVGTIYYIGYTFNIMTIMVTSLTIGIGIDYSIHATQSFRLIADRTGDIRKAVSTTIGHTGAALLIAALTTVAGFSLLILAPMPPEQQFGIITSMTVIYSYVSSIIILPPLLLKWGEWRKNKRGFIISPSKSRDK